MDMAVEAKAQSHFPDASIARPELKTPKAAAVAGLVFSALLIAIFALLRSAVPANPLEQGTWLKGDLTKVQIVLNLLPFAAVAFLWFMGFLRDCLGKREDRFFATMLLGSGFLFLSMLFMLAALMGGILIAYSIRPEKMPESEAFHIVRAASYDIANIYMTKMAAVFMFATSKVMFHIGMMPRWLTWVGYGLAAAILIGSYYLSWSLMVFPFWILLISFWMRRYDRQEAASSSR